MSTVPRDVAPAPGRIRPFDFPRVETTRAANGVRVLAARHGHVPVVTAQVVVDAGATLEARSRTGLAHLTANALDTGAGPHTGEELAWAFENLGVELEVEVSWDAILIRATSPSSRLEPTLALLADVVRRPTFPAAEVERVRDEQVAAILQRRTEPRALANDMAARFIFGADSLYGRAVLGTRVGVERLTPGDVAAFHHAHFVPAATTIVLVGDVDAAAAIGAVLPHFDDWTGEPIGRPAPEVSSRSQGTTIFLVDRPGAAQTEIRAGDIGVPRAHADYFPLEVMNTLLGGAFTSRLNINLRERHGFTYGVRSAFHYRRGPGPFVIHTAVATDVTARAIQEILHEVETLRADGAEDDEVSNARDYLAGVMPLELQTTEQLAGRLADLVIFDLPADYFEHYRREIARVTRADVARVARSHLRPDHLAIIVVGDAAAIEADLRELDRGPVEVHRLEELAS